MADKLILCKACGNEVAKSAKACPNCGARPKKPFFKTLNGKLLKYIFILFIFIGIDFFLNERSLPINEPVVEPGSSQSLSDILNESVNGSSNEEEAIQTDDTNEVEEDVMTDESTDISSDETTLPLETNDENSDATETQ